MKKIIFILLAHLTVFLGFSQKVVIVGMNHRTTDGFSFTATLDLPAGEIVYFTDNSYASGTNAFTYGGFPSGEAVIKYEVGAGGLAKGVVVFVDETSANVLSTTCSSGDCGTATVSTATGNGSFSIATNGDGLYAYADTDEDSTNGVTDIYSVLFTGSGIAPGQNGGAIPTSEDPSADFPCAIVVDGFPDDGDLFIGLDRVEYMYDPATFRDGITKANFEDISNWLHTLPNQALSTVAFTNLDAADTVPPVVTCPADITVNNDFEECGAVVDFMASATDNCPGVTTSSVPASGSLFPVGTTSVLVTATDAFGNTATCSFEVTVNDVEDPMITCPLDIVVNSAPGECGALVTFTNPTVTDNCGALPEFIINGGFETGDFSGWTVMNSGSGNYAMNDGTFDPAGPGGALPPLAGSFDIVSNQGGPGLHLVSQLIMVPTGITQANISWLDRIRNYAGTGFSDPNQEFRVMLLDAAMTPIQEIFSTNPGDPNTQLGPNSRNFDVTTLLQSLEGTQVYLSLEEQDDQGFFNVSLDNISFVINSGGGALTVTQTAGLPSGSTFPVGTTTNTFVATDASFNTATCSFDITVNDDTDPTIICPADIVVDADPGTCGATGIYLGVPMVSDNCEVTGNAIDFDGLDHGLTIPDITPDLLVTGMFTISGWIYPRLENEDFPDIQEIKDLFKLNTWLHLAITFDGAAVKGYLDGKLIATTPATTAEIIGLIAANQDLDVGALIEPFIPVSLGGKLDEVRIWNVARTQAELQANMCKEISAQPGLIALYHFNQGVAGGDNTGLTTVIDDSGNGYDLTLHNFALMGPTSNWVEGKTFTGVTLTNDAPALYVPIVYDVEGVPITWTGTNTAVYPIGETMVTWTATDASGNTATCVQKVTVGSGPATWSGAVDSDWTNAGNWVGGVTPGLSLSSDVTIPNGAPNYPVLSLGQDLTINDCATVTVESAASLTVNPNVVVTNLGTVTNDGNFTFESDNTGSAYIGSGSGTFNGDFTAERFIPANRAFRLLSTSVTTSDFISNNWQQGTHITGSTTGANGFDATVTGNPSMFTFDNLGQTWDPIPNTDATNLINGTPYRLLVRGDRTVDIGTNDPPPTPTTLVARGTLDAENIAPGALALNPNAGLFSFVGNPFQAQMDMATTLGFPATNTNLNPIFYWVYDPNLGIRGAYSTVVLPSNTSTAGSVADKYLQAGQACFVQTVADGASSITFTQNNKHTSSPETNVFKSGSSKAAASTGQLSLNLFEANAFANNDTAADGILIFFDDNGNNAVDFLDAPKFPNLDETFGTYTDGSFLSVENRATPTEFDEIQLQIYQYRNTNYVMVVNATDLQGGVPYLLDTFTGISTEIPQSGTIAYAFNINASDTGSVSANRFKIVFSATTLSTENAELSKLLLYPNPASEGFVNLSIPQGMDDLELTIYNTLGAELLHMKNFKSNKVTIATSFAKQQGVYFVKLASNGNTITKKLIIE
ncbi:HYR domain-containing protein [Hyunsoonleella rubra]|uniref:HYR domain-containing protein n=1 Tax=Hyunsoonleella rubra TaxID=1737062 RepID=A0ABW5T9W9_9FLAO